MADNVENQGPAGGGSQATGAPSTGDLYRTLYENANDAIFLLEGGVFSACNPRTRVLFGAEAHEILGRSPVDFSPERQPDGSTSVEAAEQRIRAALEGQPQFFEWLHVRKDGTLFEAEVSLNRLPAGDRFLLQAIVRDVSRRKRAEEALARERLLADTMMETLPGVLVVLDEGGQYVRVNRSVLVQPGYTLELLQAQPPFHYVHPSDVDKVQGAVRTVFDKGEVVVEARYEVRAGETKWFRLLGRRMEVGGVRYAVAVAFDITDHLVGEARLAEALEEVTRLRNRLQDENQYLRRELRSYHGKGEIIGKSPSLRATMEQVDQVARTDSTVLLMGETGTGKELFADAIHGRSLRGEHPMVRVNCAALPHALIESELFGRDKGAYTGALSKQVGRFELATGSTIFLDEIGELPLSVQGKLLRVLQDREFQRVGGAKTVTADVRVVSATNRDLEVQVAQGRFRSDLYYRIKVVELRLPPLRARGADDITRLARHFVTQAAKRHGRPAPTLPASTVRRLVSYGWPGNVRELENCLESAVVIMDGEVLHPEHLPLPECASVATTSIPAVVGTPREAAPAGLATLAEVERSHILSVLEAVGGNRSEAARVLDIGRNTLARKLHEYGVT